MNTCPLCGGEIEMIDGTYIYEWPPDMQRKTSRFDNAHWERCRECGDHSLPDTLIVRIEYAHEHG